MKDNSMTSKDINTDKQKLEYSTCIDFCKYSGGVQFAQISVFLVAMSGFVYFIFGDKQHAAWLLPYFKLGAAVIAACLWAAEESHAYLTSHFIKRAVNLETIFNFQGLSKLPTTNSYWLGPTNWAYRILYGGFVVFWITMYIKG